jgi:hypothetical protein
MMQPSACELGEGASRPLPQLASGIGIGFPGVPGMLVAGARLVQTVSRSCKGATVWFVSTARMFREPLLPAHQLSEVPTQTP